MRYPTPLEHIIPYCPLVTNMLPKAIRTYLSWLRNPRVIPDDADPDAGSHPPSRGLSTGVSMMHEKNKTSQDSDKTSVSPQSKCQKLTAGLRIVSPEVLTALNYISLLMNWNAKCVLDPWTEVRNLLLLWSIGALPPAL